MKKGLYLFIILTLTWLIVGCKTTEQVTPPENTIWIHDNAFEPSVLTVTPNTVVTWVNKGSLNHAIKRGLPIAGTGFSRVLVENFQSGILVPGDSFTHKFQWEGDWQYHCYIHPTIPIARIKVQF